MYNLKMEKPKEWAEAIQNNDFTPVIKAGIIEAIDLETLLYIPSERGINGLPLPFKTPIFIPRELSIWFEGTITYTAKTDDVAVTIGDDKNSNYAKRIRCILNRLNQSNWASDSNVGIKIFNLVTAEEVIVGASRNTVGVIFAARDRAFAYNKNIKLGDFYDNLVAAKLENIGGGWVNENMFHGGSFKVSSGLSANETIDKRGKIITAFQLFGSNVHTINANEFISPCFEGAARTFEGYRCFHINKSAVKNIVKGGRLEVDIDQNKLIRVHLDGGLSPIVDFSWDLLYDSYDVLAKEAIVDCSHPEVSSNANNLFIKKYVPVSNVIGGEVLAGLFTQAYADGRAYIPGWNWYGANSAPTLCSPNNAVNTDGSNIYIGRDANFGIGKRLDLSSCRHITIVPDGQNGRLYIRLLDENKNLIKDNVETVGILNNVRLVSGGVYWTKNSFAWITSVNAGPVTVAISKRAKYADVFYIGSTKDFAMRSLTIIGHYGALQESPIDGYRGNTSRWMWQDPNTFQDSASAYCITSGGKIIEVILQYSPIYHEPPQISLPGGAKATCTLVNGRIDKILITNGGIGVTGYPSAGFSKVDSDKTFAYNGETFKNASFNGAESGLGSIKGWVRSGPRNYSVLV